MPPRVNHSLRVGAGATLVAEVEGLAGTMYATRSSVVASSGTSSSPFSTLPPGGLLGWHSGPPQSSSYRLVRWAEVCALVAWIKLKGARLSVDLVGASPTLSRPVALKGRDVAFGVELSVSRPDDGLGLLPGSWVGITAAPI